MRLETARGLVGMWRAGSLFVGRSGIRAVTFISPCSSMRTAVASLGRSPRHGGDALEHWPLSATFETCASQRASLFETRTNGFPIYEGSVELMGP